MKNLVWLLFAVGVVLIAFGWWGQHTQTGRQRFDEMAGMIPVAAYYAGLAIGTGAILWLAILALWTGLTSR